MVLQIMLWGGGGKVLKKNLSREESFNSHAGLAVFVLGSMLMLMLLIVMSLLRLPNIV